MLKCKLSDFIARPIDECLNLLPISSLYLHPEGSSSDSLLKGLVAIMFAFCQTVLIKCVRVRTAAH